MMTAGEVAEDAHHPMRNRIRTAMKEWRDDRAGFLDATGSGEPQTVYLLDPADPVGVLHPLKAVAKRVLGDLGSGFTTRRYEARLNPKSYGFEVITANERERVEWVSAAEANIDIMEGDTAEVRIQKRHRNREIVASFKRDHVKAGTLICEVCQITGEKLGGTKIPKIRHPSLFDADHKIPISQGKRPTRKADLTLICLNYHQLKHVFERTKAILSPAG